MTETNALSERIRAFILEKFPVARKRGLKNNDKLLESGILDSLGILDLVGFLEEELKVSISDEELVPENFQSVECLAVFLHRKTNHNAGRMV